MRIGKRPERAVEVVGLRARPSYSDADAEARMAVIKFPKPYRPPPAQAAVRVLATTEYLVICGDHAWAHGDLRSALRDALDLADELNAPIEINGPTREG